MAVVKIKDANGNWQNVVALKGDKGDTGDQGPAGPAGTTSFAGLTDVPNRVKNAVSSVNGISADASGNVAISVGTVSQKHGSTFTVADSGTTKTITGLTANKPVFIGFKNNSTMISVAMMITSGCATNNGSKSVHTGNSTSQKQVDFFAVVPTGTSLVIAMHPQQTGSNPSVTLYVYQ